MRTKHTSFIATSLLTTFLLTLGSDTRDSLAQDTNVARGHRGHVATWGPVLRDSKGEIVQRGRPGGARSWAEYQANSNRVVRTFWMNGEYVLSGNAYNAIVTRWKDARVEFAQNNPGQAVEQVNVATYESTPCLDRAGNLTTPPERGEQARWVLIRAFDALDPSACDELAVIDSPLEHPDDFLPPDVSSVLVDSYYGVVRDTAVDGNYFAIETALFSPPSDAPCAIDEPAPPGVQVSAFEDCDWVVSSSYMWAPIQNVRVRSSSGFIKPNYRYGASRDNDDGTSTSFSAYRYKDGDSTNKDPSNIRTDEEIFELFGVRDGVELDLRDWVNTTPDGLYDLPLSFPIFELLVAARSSLVYAIAQGTTQADIYDGLFGRGEYTLSAEIRYDSFNPRRPYSGYYLVESDHPIIRDDYVKTTNIAVDATTLTILARMMKGPERSFDARTSVPVTYVDLDGSINADQFTEYDVRPTARGEVTDTLGNTLNQGLLSQINVLDLSRTDTYIFRESDGRLIGTRQGVSPSSVPAWDRDNPQNVPPAGCEFDACLQFSTITRGPATSNGSAAGQVRDPNFWDYQALEIVGGFNRTEALTTSRDARGAQYEVFARFGDAVRVVLVNRATGYIGTFRARVELGPNGLPTYRQISDEDTTGQFMAEVDLRPPNLKISARRAFRQRPGDQGQQLQKKIIGADGAAITSDEYIVVTTEWYDEDGGPLPDGLPGFTGRLSRVVEGEFVAGTGVAGLTDEVGLFPIRPGKHVVNIQLPDTDVGLERTHFYVHVSGAPTDELAYFAPGVGGDDKPNFSSNQVCHEVPTVEEVPVDADAGADSGTTRRVSDTRWICTTRGQDRPGMAARPALFVPFQVARLDADATRAAADARRRELADAFRYLSTLPVLDDVDRIYRWAYSPEYHFSIYDLEVHDVSVTTDYDADDGIRTDVRVSYDLTGSGSDDVPRAGQDEVESGLDWGVGYDKVEAVLGQGSVAEMADRLTPDDFVALDLFVDGDEDNTLYELENLALIYANPRPLDFKRYQITSLNADGTFASRRDVDSVDMIRVVVTREVELEPTIEFERDGFPVVVRIFAGGLNSTRLPAGEYFIPLGIPELLDAGVDADHPEFTVRIRATNTSDEYHSHDVVFTGTYSEVPLGWGQGLSLDTLGRMGRTVGTDGSFSGNLSGASESRGASAQWGNGGVALRDGSLRLQREDFELPTVGPSLHLRRAYTNLTPATNDGPFGPGWSHDLVVELVPLALDGEAFDPTGPPPPSTPGWFDRLKAEQIVGREAFDRLEVPTQWGEVQVKGLRFVRTGGLWQAERGGQGKLEEIGEEFHFTDLDGTVYIFDQPRIPLPSTAGTSPTFATSAPGDAGAADVSGAGGDGGAGDAGSVDPADPPDVGSFDPTIPPAYVYTKDRLVHRISAVPVTATPGSPSGDVDAGGFPASNFGAIAPPPSSTPQVFGQPQPSRAKRAVARNGHELVYEYDPIAPALITKVTDSFGREMVFDHVACTDASCASTSGLAQRISRVRLLDAQGGELKRATFTYTDDGYLETAACAGVSSTLDAQGQRTGTLETVRLERYTYADEPDGVGKNLTATTVAVSSIDAAGLDAADAQTTTYTYFDPGTSGAQISGVPVRLHEVLESMTLATYPGEPEATTHYAYGFSPTGQVERKVTNARGEETRYILNEWGNPIEVHEPLGRTRKMTWAIDDPGLTGNYTTSVSSSYAADGSTMRRARHGEQTDVFGRTTKVWSCPPEEVPTSQVMAALPSQSRCPLAEAEDVVELDPNLGAPTRHTDRHGFVEEWIYAADGTMTLYEDPLGLQLSATYHTGANNPLRGLKLSESIAGRWTRAFSYDANGFVASVDTTVELPDGNLTGQPRRTETVTMTHDALGRVLSVTQPDGTTTRYEYDGADRVTVTHYPGLDTCEPDITHLQVACVGEYTSTQRYDGVGNVVSSTDPAGLTARYAYTGRGLMRALYRPSHDGSGGEDARYMFHDANGNVTWQTNWMAKPSPEPTSADDVPREDRVERTYDALDRLTATTNQLGHTSQLVLDLAGRIVESRDANGVSTHSAYDVYDRLLDQCVGEPCDFGGERSGPRVSTVYESDGPADGVDYAVTTTNHRGRGLADAVSTSFIDGSGRVTRVEEPYGRVHERFYDATTQLLTHEIGVEGERFDHDLDGLERVWGVTQTDQHAGTNQARVTRNVLDLRGRLVETHGPLTRANGDPLVRRTEYDSWSRPYRSRVAFTDALGQEQEQVSRIAFDARGSLVYKDSVGPNRPFSRVDRDLLGRIVQVDGPTGERVTTRYDVRGRVVEELVAGDANFGTPDLRTCYIYDARNVLVATHTGVPVPCDQPYDPNDVEIHVWTATQVDPAGYTREATDAFGRKTSVVFDSAYRVVDSSVSADGETLPLGSVVLAADGLPVSQTDPLGNTTTYTYDELGRMTGVSFESSSQDPALAYTETWDHLTDRVVTHTDREGVVVVQRFDDFGNLLSATLDGQPRFTGTYDPAGLMLTSSDGRGSTTRYTYEDRGMATLVELPDVGGATPDTARSVFDVHGRLIQQIDPLGYTTDFTHDAAGRVTGTSYRGESSQVWFDTRGQAVRVASPWQLSQSSNTRTFFDRHGRPTSVYEDGTSAVTRYEYNKANLLVRVEGTNGAEELIGYDGFGRMNRHRRKAGCTTDTTACTDAASYLESTFGGFDVVGNPGTTTDPLGQTTSYTYDDLGRLSRVDYPVRADQPDDTPRPTYSQMVYDTFNRPVSTTRHQSWPGLGDTTNVHTSAYDPIGRMDHTTRAHQWFKDGVLESLTAGHDYAWDASDNLTCLSTASTTGCASPDERATLYQRDLRHRITQLTIPKAGGDQTTTFAYDSISRPTLVSYPNGASTTFGYHDQDPASGDATTRLKLLEHANASETLAHIEYAYHVGGLRKSELRTSPGSADETRTYEYDPMGRLTKSHTLKGLELDERVYGYLGQLRISQKVYSGLSKELTEDLEYKYDDALRMREIVEHVSMTHERIFWDDNGNMTRWDRPTTEHHYRYDALNQLVSSVDDPTNPADLSSGTVTGRYAYDGMGQRFLVDEPHKSTHLIRTHSGGKVVSQWKDGLTDPERYHFAGSRLHSLDTGVELGFFHHDARGDVLGLSDSTGTLVGKQSIDVWGKRTLASADTSTLSGQRFGFTGHEHDANGLVHMQARSYNPTLGTFITEDPAPGTLLDPRSRLKHIYAHHDPVNRFDPDGRSTRFIGQHGNSVGSLGSVGLETGGISYGGFDWSSHNAFQGAFAGAAAASRLAEVNIYNQTVAAEIDAMGTELFLQQTTAVFNLVPVAGTMAGNFVRGRLKRQIMIAQGLDVSNYEYTDGLFEGTIFEAAHQWHTGELDSMSFAEQAIGALATGGALSGMAASSLYRMRRMAGSAASRNATRLIRSVNSRIGKTPNTRTSKNHGHAAHDKPRVKEKVEPQREKEQVGAVGCPIPRKNAILGNSFEEGTEVLMCDGTLKAINEIEVGEFVLAKNPDNGDVDCKRVIHTMSHLDDDLVVVKVGEDSFRTTWHHPFIDDDGRSFRVMAQRGRVQGEEGTFSTFGGRALAFAGALEHDDPVEVFNIDVEGFDSYFVGREGVWSHNSDESTLGGCPGASNSMEGFGGGSWHESLPDIVPGFGASINPDLIHNGPFSGLHKTNDRRQIELELDAAFDNARSNYRFRIESDALTNPYRNTGVVDLDPIDIRRDPSRDRIWYQDQMTLNDVQAIDLYHFDGSNIATSVQPLDLPDNLYGRIRFRAHASDFIAPAGSNSFRGPSVNLSARKNHSYNPESGNMTHQAHTTDDADINNTHIPYLGVDD